MRQWTARHRLAASGNGGVGGNDSSSALLSILPSGPTTAQIANPTGLTDARGNTLAFNRAQAAFCRKSLVSDPSNLIQNPESIGAGGGIWQTTGVGAPSISLNNAAAPDGTQSATKADFGATSAANSRGLLYQNVATGAGTHTFSFYVKGVSGSGTLYASIQAGSAPDASFSFNPDSWTRCTLTATGLSAGSTPFAIGTDRLVYPAEPAGPAQSVYLWGAKVEAAASATTYVSPMLVSILANTARVEPEGLLLETASTNLAIQSQTFDNAAWAKVTNTVTADAGIAPDGTLTADSALSTGASATLTSTGAATASAIAYTGSIYVRLVSGNGAGFLKLKDSGGTFPGSQAFTATSQWQRISVSGTSVAAGSLSVQVVTTTSGDTLQLWGAQLEAFPYCTSYIPTTAASVPRGADLITYGTCGSGALAPITLTSGRFAMTFNPFGWNSAGSTQVPGGATQVTGSSSVLYMNSGDLSLYSYNGSAAVSLDSQAHDGVPRKYQITWTSGSRTIDDFTDGTSSTNPTPFTVSFAGQTFISSGFQAHLTDIAIYRS